MSAASMYATCCRLSAGARRDRLEPDGSCGDPSSATWRAPPIVRGNSPPARTFVSRRRRRARRALKLLHWYTEKVHKAASVSPQVTERFYEVMHLLKAPTALFTPAILWKVATSKAARRSCAAGLDQTSVALRL
jgi:hypothetical protein